MEGLILAASGRELGGRVEICSADRMTDNGVLFANRFVVLEVFAVVLAILPFAAAVEINNAVLRGIFELGFEGGRSLAPAIDHPIGKFGVLLLSSFLPQPIEREFNFWVTARPNSLVRSKSVGDAFNGFKGNGHQPGVAHLVEGDTGFDEVA